MKIDYLLTCFQNGDHHLPNYHYREIKGLGELAQERGEFTLELDITFGRSPSFEPGVIILICCDNLRFFSANLNSVVFAKDFRSRLPMIEYGGCVNKTRSGFFLAPDGSVVLNVKAKGILFLKDGIAYSRTVVYEHDSKLDQFGGIKEIITPYTERIIPTAPGRATGISLYKVLCNDGTILDGCTDYPYVFNDSPDLPRDLILPQEMALQVNTAEVNWDDYRAGANPRYRVGIEGTVI
ncbi:MAG: hypothetical protein RPG89_03170 [Microcystis panniformis WG22]|nr:hypothetical protein [Microcystis panniformis WG22]